MVNIFLAGMIIQVDLHPRDNVVIVEAECPAVEECKATEIIMEACDFDVQLNNCINEKFEYGDQIDAINNIIHPDYGF